MFQILLCSWLRTIELHAVSGSCVRMTSRPRLAAVIQSKGSAALSRDVWHMEGPVLEVRGRWSIDFCWQSHRDFSREQYCVSFRHAAKWFSFILFQTVLHHRLSRDTEYRSLCYTVRLHAHLFYMPVCVSCSIVTPQTAVHQAPLSMGILQARILEWVAIPSSRGSSQPRDQTQVSSIADGSITFWATREAQEYWSR